MRWQWQGPIQGGKPDGGSFRIQIGSVRFGWSNDKN